MLCLDSSKPLFAQQALLCQKNLRALARLILLAEIETFPFASMDTQAQLRQALSLQQLRQHQLLPIQETQKIVVHLQPGQRAPGHCKILIASISTYSCCGSWLQNSVHLWRRARRSSVGSTVPLEAAIFSMFSLHAAWPFKPCVALANCFHVRSSWKQAIVGRSAQEGCPSAQKHAGYIAKTAISPFQSRVGCMTVELHIYIYINLRHEWWTTKKMQVQENRNFSPMCRLGSKFFFAETCWNQHKFAQVINHEVANPHCPFADVAFPIQQGPIWFVRSTQLSHRHEWVLMLAASTLRDTTTRRCDTPQRNWSKFLFWSLLGFCPRLSGWFGMFRLLGPSCSKGLDPEWLEQLKSKSERMPKMPSWKGASSSSSSPAHQDRVATKCEFQESAKWAWTNVWQRCKLSSTVCNANVASIKPVSIQEFLRPPNT